MPRSTARREPLKIGDSVDVCSYQFNPEWALANARRLNDKESGGTVTGKDARGQWIVSFTDGTTCTAPREKITLVRRPTALTHETVWRHNGGTAMVRYGDTAPPPPLSAAPPPRRERQVHPNGEDGDDESMDLENFAAEHGLSIGSVTVEESGGAFDFDGDQSSTEEAVRRAAPPSSSASEAPSPPRPPVPEVPGRLPRNAAGKARAALNKNLDTERENGSAGSVELSSSDDLPISSDEEERPLRRPARSAKRSGGAGTSGAPKRAAPKAKVPRRKKAAAAPQDTREYAAAPPHPSLPCPVPGGLIESNRAQPPILPRTGRSHRVQLCAPLLSLLPPTHPHFDCC